MELTEIFLDKLKNAKPNKKDFIKFIYINLFEMIDKDYLEQELDHILSIYSGKDKSLSPGNWFLAFHRKLRKERFFQNVFYHNKVNALSVKEYGQLKGLEKSLEEKKVPKRDALGNFTAEYSKYMELKAKKDHDIDEMPISQNLDNVLWNVIHLDDENILYTSLEDTFDIKSQADKVNKR